MARVDLILGRRCRIIMPLEERKDCLAQDEMHGLGFLIVEQEAGEPIDTYFKVGYLSCNDPLIRSFERE